ncbi:3,4-dihydroxy-2-butanone 4-phosphate synthase (EC / GTP cyclohydrolase II (EC [uncultured Gammaproteobacteria bacterium]|jgi:3,4-dihydroxy 2-butanone 4-phosphate synthase/GTP cyclohydrolase II|nr:3,4-dihydroxy-2-butanone 4-phosphate synthase (EC / GTP cyclohydrolase II (EC [uncultured Gammaproteobacteria bacterium]
MAQPGGVLIRPGHTEAGCDLARLAGLEPASVIVEILNDDGSMARRDDLGLFAEKHGIKWGTIEDLISYRVENEKTIERIDERPFNTKYGEWTLVSFLDSIHQQTHTALVKGNIDKDTPVCVRVHMENVFTDILQENAKSLHVNDALAYISKERSGVFLLIRPHEASSDVKTYGVGAQILSDLGVGKMRILGSPRKLNALKGFGLEVVEYITGGK